MRLEWGKWPRRPLVVAGIAAVMLFVLVVPVNAGNSGNGANQIAGVGDVIAFGFTADCPEPEGYETYDDLTIYLSDGNLQGCWYTLVEESKFSPSDTASPVVYQERGQEVFVGELYDDDGVLVGEGTFETTYKFTGKYTDASLVEEIHGRCQHPIVAGQGSGVFDGATGRVDFKDFPDDDPTLQYRGHLKNLNLNGT